MRRALSGRWLPAPGVDEAARAARDETFLAVAERRTRPDGETGVFAKHPLPAGTILVHRWHDDFYLGMEGWRVLSLEEMERLPPDVFALFRRYGLDHDFGYIYGPDDHDAVYTLDNFINHSCAPNLGYDEEGNVITLVAVPRDGELCIDYGAFVVNYDEPFECACGAASCRGRVTRLDWERLDSRLLPPFVRRRR